MTNAADPLEEPELNALGAPALAPAAQAHASSLVPVPAQAPAPAPFPAPALALAPRCEVIAIDTRVVTRTHLKAMFVSIWQQNCSSFDVFSA